MSRVGTRRIEPPSGSGALDWNELRASSDLLRLLVWRNLALRYKQTVIGAGWAVLQPVSTMIVLSLIFGRLAGLPSDGLPYPIFYYAGLLPWTYFANALGAATNSIPDHQRVITRVYFPRILLPVSSVLSGLVDLGIASLVLVVLLFWYRVPPSPAMLALPLFAGMAVLTALGVGLWFAATNALFRDLRYALQFVVTLWMFVSPVTYPASLVPWGWRLLYGLNPMAGTIEGFRWAVTGGPAPSLLLLATSLASAVVIAVGGARYFQRIEPSMADVV